MSECGLLIPNLHVLEGHSASSPWPQCFQGALTKLVSREGFDAFTVALDVLSEAGRPPGENDPYGGVKTQDLLRVRDQSLCSPGALVFSTGLVL